MSTVVDAFYHVTLRGNHRKDIFFGPTDRRLLDGFVLDALEVTRARIHLLIQVADIPLGAFMQRIASRYARHRHVD